MRDHWLNAIFEDGMSEHDEQVTVIEWARWNSGRWPCLEWLHSIPNGASYGMDKKFAYAHSAKLKAEGLTPGICDLFLPWASRGYHGLYIEMKRPGNLAGVRDGQVEFMAYVESAGYIAQVHDTAQGAIEFLEWYLTDDTQTEI